MATAVKMALAELEDLVPIADLRQAYDALAAATLVAQRLSYGTAHHDAQSESPPLGSTTMAMRNIDVAIPLSALLRSYLRMTFEWPRSKSTVAARVCTLFALEHYSLDKLVGEVASVCDQYPTRSAEFAQFLLRAPDVRRSDLWECPSVARFSKDTFTSVLRLATRPAYLEFHRAAFTPPLTDEDLTLASVLLTEWTGSLASLVETVRALELN
jgi:hypothetical protein